MKKDLLHSLSELVGCAYLSDLRFVTDPARIKSALEFLPAQEYPVYQWNNTVKYLTGKLMTFTHSSEAKEYLIERL